MGLLVVSRTDDRWLNEQTAIATAYPPTNWPARKFGNCSDGNSTIGLLTINRSHCCDDAEIARLQSSRPRRAKCRLVRALRLVLVRWTGRAAGGRAFLGCRRC